MGKGARLNAARHSAYCIVGGSVGIRGACGCASCARNSGNRRNDAANTPNLFTINDAEAISSRPRVNRARAQEN